MFIHFLQKCAVSVTKMKYLTVTLFDTEFISLEGDNIIQEILQDKREILIEKGQWYAKTSQIPEFTCSKSHNVPFRTEMCTFLF